MIVQRRGDRVRLFTQHDHGLLSGELAAAWEEPSTGRRLDAALVLAITLHDVAWQQLDHKTLLVDKQGIPLDFLRWPEAEKLHVYSQGIEELAEMHPWAGVLLSLHYTSFVQPEDAPEFHEHQRQLREQLRARAAAYATRTRDEERDFELLRLMDVLSLVACICEPGSDVDSCPIWLRPDVIEERFGYVVRWTADSATPTITVNPFPFGAEVRTSIPWREAALAALQAPGPTAWQEGQLDVRFCAPDAAD